MGIEILTFGDIEKKKKVYRHIRLLFWGVCRY